MFHKIFIINLICFFVNHIYANFKPLTANHLEARIGAFYQANAKKLRLDIGHSLDITNIYTGKLNQPLENNKNERHISTDVKVDIGGDFFVLSRLRTEGRFKFPVETADYYFGVNTTANFLHDYQHRIGFRLRVGHISSHLIDGYTNKENEFLQKPFVYSREFIDFVCSYNWEDHYSNIQSPRVYIGLTSIFSTLPKNVNKFVPNTGFDWEYKFGKQEKKWTITLGYDGKLIGEKDIPNVWCNAAQIGLGLNGINIVQSGEMPDKKKICSSGVALSLNYYYYNGYSIHGMFYNKREQYTGIGIQITY